MKKKIVYNFDGGDPPWGSRLDQAFNPLMEFAPELKGRTELLPEQKAFNRLTGNGFAAEDIKIIQEYSQVVINRVLNKYSSGVYMGAPWAEALRQDINRLKEEVAAFVEWFENEDTR